MALSLLVGFNYLKNPAHGFARGLVYAGEIGMINLFRDIFGQDLMSDPGVPFSWRQEKIIAGSGALGDMASHICGSVRFHGQTATGPSPR